MFFYGLCPCNYNYIVDVVDGYLNDDFINGN